jgi:ribosomal protein S18 acetylase RimI-like enzyme
MIVSAPMIILKPVTPETSEIFKAVRLRALADSPLAFSSTYAKESLLSEEEWMKRSQRWAGQDAIAYLAFDDSDHRTACGLVACYAEDHGVPRGHVISMWVDPAFRRAGVGRILIDALKSWARSRDLSELKLMVTSVNQGAIRFYERIGFQMSGIVGAYPNDPSIVEYEMLLRTYP